MGEDHAAHSAARRVVHARVASAGGRWAPHHSSASASGRSCVAVRVGEQLRRGAIARTTGRLVGREHLAQPAALATRVRDHVACRGARATAGATDPRVLARARAARVEPRVVAPWDRELGGVCGSEPAALGGIATTLLIERVRVEAPSRCRCSWRSARFALCCAASWGDRDGMSRGDRRELGAQRDRDRAVDELAVARGASRSSSASPAGQNASRATGSNSGGTKPATCQRPPSMPENARRYPMRPSGVATTSTPNILPPPGAFKPGAWSRRTSSSS